MPLENSNQLDSCGAGRKYIISVAGQYFIGNLLYKTRLTSTWVTFDHLVGRFKASVCDLSDRELFVVSLLSNNILVIAIFFYFCDNID